MTYGLPQKFTNDLIEWRAFQERITKFQIAPPLPTEEELDAGEQLADDVFEVSVICDGFLDEEFTVKSMWVVNIADWIAEDCMAAKERGDIEDFEVLVHEWNPWEAGDLVYRTTDEMETVPSYVAKHA